ncbi:MAG: class I SAM-dependent methyltransferase [Pseudomonadota bacterium]
MTSPPCRGCGGMTERVGDLGQLPLVDRFPIVGSDPEVDALFPLKLSMCQRCALFQIENCPPPDVLFDADYRYLSSISSDWLSAAKDMAMTVAPTLRPGGTVVEIAANDGYQLRWFRDLGFRAIGIDPAPLPVARARSEGLDIRQAFFDLEMAEALAEETGGADLVIAKNVLAHVPAPNRLLQAMARLLRPGGRVIIEVPWLGDLLANGAIDTIYHEHHCVFSAHTLEMLATDAGLSITEVQRLPFHAGSLRVSMALGADDDLKPDSLNALLALEREQGTWNAQKVRDLLTRAKADFRQMESKLRDAIAAGQTLAAYGAAAKGVVFAALSGLADLPIKYVLDRNPEKHGRRMPGTGIPILPVEHLLTDPPDICLILCWNWADEVIADQKEYLHHGGRFWVPLPEFREVSDRAL